MYLRCFTPRLLCQQQAFVPTAVIVRHVLYSQKNITLSTTGDSKVYTSQSGCHYNIEQVLLEDRSPIRRVYCATYAKTFLLITITYLLLP